VRVGDAQLPTDLGGVVYLQLASLPEYEDETIYDDTEVEPRVLPWLRNLDAASGNGARIADLLTRLAPNATSHDRIRLKARILSDQVNPSVLPRLPRDQLAQILLKYTYRRGHEEEVGYSHTTPVDPYLDLARVVPDSEDERSLAGHLARYVADLVSRKIVRPTTVAISKTATAGVLGKAADLLPFPEILVSPYGPNRETPIEGFYEPGDKAVLLHDVALSGNHLVECVMSLRASGFDATDLIALVQYKTEGIAFENLMAENGISVHTATVFEPSPRYATVQPSLALSGQFLPGSASSCVLCDVLEGKDSVPFRQYFLRDELANEVLHETDLFSVVADVAPLTDGHVLLVSKTHALSMASFPSDALRELDSLRIFISDLLTREYPGRAIAFEHGLCDSSRSPGCGIDHAHLHLLPLKASISRVFERNFDVRVLPSIVDIASTAPKQGEYLLLIDQDGLHQFAVASAPTRQFFRRTISEIEGNEIWNWSDRVLLDDRVETRSKLLKLHEVFSRVRDIEAR
jgi:diadenosine tetraphosphate (Ap4A) HIT family hydrolase/orotate phosphoribosyltransferase